VRIGILALQGDFAEHIAMLSRLGVDTFPVRLPSQISNLDGLVIPGGESTTISKLMAEYALAKPIRELAYQGLPIWGTCAGMVLLAKEITNSANGTLGIMDIKVERNTFGRQVDSFETDLPIPALGNHPFRGVFIRAPIIEEAGPKVEILCQLSDGVIVAAREENCLACSFHPELTDDSRFHEYFLTLTKEGVFAKRNH
jgi:5'-phosphate synthase pdxT subunit